MERSDCEELLEVGEQRDRDELKECLARPFWSLRLLTLALGFAAIAASFTLRQARVTSVERVRDIEGEFMEEWKFEEVKLDSGDEVYDVLFNQTLFECIEPVKADAVARGRCYDEIFARQNKCLDLRKEDPPASCHRTVQCLKGKKEEKGLNPCDWLCTGKGDQAFVKDACSKSLYDAELWSGKCLDSGYHEKSRKAMQEANRLSQQCSDDASSVQKEVGSNFFCWALVVPWTNEVDLLLMQQRLQKGIFECDAHEIYSDREMHIGTIKTVKVDTDLHCKMNKMTLTVENTRIFRAVWRKVLDRMVWKNYDWTVKADLDSVFVPTRLLNYVEGDKWIQDHAQTGTGLWLNNCWRGLHGPIEVLSKRAMQIYSDRWTQCHGTKMAYPQEDVYLMECLQHLGIWKADVKHLLAEDHCDHHDYYKCEGNFVAYHPFKEEKNWMTCRDKLSSIDYNNELAA
ncbi:Copia protein [Durusdinium trenchii]|uniref:Copia protein n=1 Tax=Durusdinium trenchii TaxID=1381693 RepID=A0ABP0RRF4_9DINO